MSSVLWKPHVGPQTDFLRASEFEVLYGGAAGGGKSDAALYGALRYVHKPSYRALILRKTYPELQELIDRSMVFKNLNGKWNEQKKRWTFPSGSTIEFGYFETWSNHARYQGQEYQYICWDELGQCPEERFWTFLMSRCRSADPSIPSVMRATANPGGAGHAWLKRRFIERCGEDGGEVWVDPVTSLARRFIPAKLVDNPALDENDPGYRKRLESLPEILRRQLLDGDWGAASGMALEELERSIHIIEQFQPPAHWWRFGAMDWGYAHPMVFGVFAVGPEGLIVLEDSLHLWRKSPLEQIERIHEKLQELGDVRLRYIAAGHDCWADVRARGENVPTVAEQYASHGLPLTKANISRVSGLNNLRRYVSVRGPLNTYQDPRFVMMKTRGNQRVYETLESMVLDEKDMEDALKVDADEYGEGGDDAYDMVRYGLASRPLEVKEPKKKKKKDRNRDNTLEGILKRHPANRKNRKKVGSIF